MADRQIIHTSSDDSSSAATVLLGIVVVALVLFGIWYIARHSGSSSPQIPNTGVPNTQINVTPGSSGGNSGAGSGAATPSPSPSGQ